MTYIFLNKKSNNGKAVAAEEKLKELFSGKEIQMIDVTSIKNAAEICGNLSESDEVVIAGGDGTVSRFINDVYELHLKQNVWFYTCGSGNDFFNDIKDCCEISNCLIKLNKFMENLPKVTVNGESHYFINGIGYGIDGYVCEEGDKIRRTSTKKVNYTKIALKGLLYAFKRRNATVSVDGVSKKYSGVWLAPTMIGRFFGGGMMISPMQNRLNEAHTVTFCIAHDLSKYRILTIFPKIFKGNHVKHTDVIDFISAHEVSVSFDVPCALQIDGETYLNVKEYSVSYN